MNYSYLSLVISATKILSKEDLPKICNNCGQDKLEQPEFYKTSFTLKGSGWFKDGYR